MLDMLLSQECFDILLYTNFKWVILYWIQRENIAEVLTFNFGIVLVGRIVVSAGRSYG